MQVVKCSRMAAARAWWPTLALAGACVAVPADSSAQSTASCASNTDQISSIAQQLMQQSACWSCQLYASVYGGMHQIVDASYQAITSGGVGATAFGITIVAIVLMARFVPFLIGTGDAAETIAGMRMYFLRVSIVFIVFLGTSSYTVMDSGGIGSNFFLDGPLAAGTDVGMMLSTATTGALASAAGAPSGTSLFGSPQMSATSGPCASIAAGSGLTSFAAEHCVAATSMLYNLHQMGAIGIITGMWMILEDPNVSFLFHLGTSIVVVCAGGFLAWTFFMFTVSFGLRYIDALVRATLIFSLTPIFMFLWIFDSTRSMAAQALKSGFALAGVFAVSGIVFSIAYYILLLGFQNAFQQGINFSGLVSIICSSGAGQGLATFLTGNAQGAQGGSLNWMAYFYLIGSGSMATACASLTFDLAAQIFDFGGAELGIGRAVQADAQGAVSSAVSILGGR